MKNGVVEPHSFPSFRADDIHKQIQKYKLKKSTPPKTVFRNDLDKWHTNA